MSVVELSEITELSDERSWILVGFLSLAFRYILSLLARRTKINKFKAYVTLELIYYYFWPFPIYKRHSTAELF